MNEAERGKAETNDDHVASARARSETFRTRLRTTGGFVGAAAAALTTGLTLNDSLTFQSSILRFEAAVTVSALILSAVFFLAGSVVSPPSFEQVKERLKKPRWQDTYNNLHHSTDPTNPGRTGIQEIVSGAGLERAQRLSRAGELAGLIGAASLLVLLISNAVLATQTVQVFVHAVDNTRWDVCGTPTRTLVGTVAAYDLDRPDSSLLPITVHCDEVPLTITLNKNSIAVQRDAR